MSDRRPAPGGRSGRRVPGVIGFVGLRVCAAETRHPGPAAPGGGALQHAGGPARRSQPQRQQIRLLPAEVNSLKDQLLSLSQFEKKIRVMADVEKRRMRATSSASVVRSPKAMDPEAAFGEHRSSLVREMRSQVDQLKLATVNQDQGFTSLVTHLEKQQRLLASTPTIRPIDPDAECCDPEIRLAQLSVHQPARVPQGFRHCRAAKEPRSTSPPTVSSASLATRACWQDHHHRSRPRHRHDLWALQPDP